MNYFKEILSNIEGNLKVLPILHTCDAYDLRNIIQDKEIRTAKCDVFEGKEYLYTFYGIPSYRKKEKLATGKLAQFPVCFVLCYDKLPTISRLFPFDTGVFIQNNGLKEKYLHPKMGLEEFELDPHISNAVKVVEKFYSTNENYVNRSNQINFEDIAPMNFEAQSYYEMITDTTDSPFDNRLSTIEIIYDTKISLENHALLHLILPHAFLDDIKTTLEDDFGINKPDTYNIVRGYPTEYWGVIYNKYLEYTKSNNLL